MRTPGLCSSSPRTVTRASLSQRSRRARQPGHAIRIAALRVCLLGIGLLAAPSLSAQQVVVPGQAALVPTQAAPVPAQAAPAPPQQPEPPPTLPPELLHEAHLGRGVALYDEGKYVQALASWQAAYAIHESPRLLYLMGQCLRKLGQHDQAQARFRSFLLVASPSKDAAFIRAAEDYLRRVDAPRPPGRGQLTVLSDRRGAHILLDGRPVGRAPLRTLEVATGLHNVLGQDGGQEAAGLVQIFPGQTGTVRLRFPQRRWVLALVGVLAGAAVAGTAIGLGSYYGTTKYIPDGQFPSP